jgi:CubicO group peptidase (beta-lactamase class C family)
MTTIDFSKVNRVFDELLQKHLHPAAQVTVYHHGELIVDYWGSQPGRQTIDGDTPFLCFSVSKVFTACAIFHLIDNGKIEIDAPIGKYWPEFAQKGKETATIRHALLHQAGVPAPHLKRQVFQWPSWNSVVNSLAREEALYVPGTETSYHLVNFGFILGEVVRRVTGQTIDEYLSVNFFTPMGFTHTSMRMRGEELQKSPYEVPVSPELKATAFLFNLPPIRKALLPAVNLRSSARGLGTFFVMLLNNGTYNGKQYLSPEILKTATRSHYNDFDKTMGFNMNWGLGFIIGGGKYLADNPREWIMGWDSSDDTFAGFGMGTCMVWADRKADLVTAFTCNGMLSVPAVDERWAALSNAVWDSINQ